MILLALALASVKAQSDQQSMTATYCPPSVLASLKPDPSFFSLAYRVIKNDRKTVTAC